MKIVKKFQLKIVIFTAVKNRCILHGRVFVMHKALFLTSAVYPGRKTTNNQTSFMMAHLALFDSCKIYYLNFSLKINFLYKKRFKGLKDNSYIDLYKEMH